MFYCLSKVYFKIFSKKKILDKRNNKLEIYFDTCSQFQLILKSVFSKFVLEIKSNFLEINISCSRSQEDWRSPGWTWAGPLASPKKEEKVKQKQASLPEGRAWQQEKASIPQGERGHSLPKGEGTNFGPKWKTKGQRSQQKSKCCQWLDKSYRRQWAQCTQWLDKSYKSQWAQGPH